MWIGVGSRRRSTSYHIENATSDGVSRGRLFTFWVEQAARTVSEDALPPGRVVAVVNLARLALERAALDLLQLAKRSVGLQGFMRGQPHWRRKVTARHTLSVLSDQATFIRGRG